MEDNFEYVVWRKTIKQDEPSSLMKLVNVNKVFGNQKWIETNNRALGIHTKS